MRLLRHELWLARTAAARLGTRRAIAVDHVVTTYEILAQYALYADEQTRHALP